MTLAEMQAEVILRTKRPELVSETISALQAATLFFHGIDDFWRDRVEGMLNTSTPAYQQQFSLSVNFPQLKKVAYIKPYDAVHSYAGKPLKGVQPSDIYCVTGRDKTNIWWLNGDALVIKTSQQVDNFLFGYFARPVVSPTANYNSWMAIHHPFALIDHAVATIMASIGFAEGAALYRAKVGEKVPVPTGHVREILMAELEYDRDLGE